MPLPWAKPVPVRPQHVLITHSLSGTVQALRDTQMKKKNSPFRREREVSKTARCRLKEIG